MFVCWYIALIYLLMTCLPPNHFSSLADAKDEESKEQSVFTFFPFNINSLPFNTMSLLNSPSFSISGQIPEACLLSLAL